MAGLLCGGRRGGLEAFDRKDIRPHCLEEKHSSFGNHPMLSGCRVNAEPLGHSLRRALAEFSDFGCAAQGGNDLVSVHEKELKHAFSH